ncbi:hypothetical protein PR048_008322 [Dryococelus australis]|uniref:argininosuccinate synthase n=1 Tax=Dryococelus australis TaxID=614101 RepID=A0ABQ9HWS8_9NEOP|nr:hypothetical protein PR048_008322 [Dryococelus australis]
MTTAYEIMSQPFKYSMRIAYHIAGDYYPDNRIYARIHGDLKQKLFEIFSYEIVAGHEIVPSRPIQRPGNVVDEGTSSSSSGNGKKPSVVVIEDLRQRFVEHYVWTAVAAGLIYESRYLLGTSLARPCITEGLVRLAEEEDASYIAHGATGKGNDQVRFELSCYSLMPTVQILAPWRMEKFTSRFQGRQNLLQYASNHGISVPVTPKEPWSMDANLMHISYESGILENPAHPAPAELFQMTSDPQKAPDSPTRLEIKFEKGIPVSVWVIGGAAPPIVDPVSMLIFLNQIGGEHGVGRIDIVENRFIGLKSRGVYETPGCTILHAAHVDLETFCLDREVLRLKTYLANRMADYVYNGFWFSPECQFVRDSIALSQRHVTGWVHVQLYKGSGEWPLWHKPSVIIVMITV